MISPRKGNTPVRTTIIIGLIELRILGKDNDKIWRLKGMGAPRRRWGPTEKGFVSVLPHLFFCLSQGFSALALLPF